jgi:crotonobetainyl-CoA:carnitine CoA-transferase CaiB-like acyl-CoA transferase
MVVSARHADLGDIRMLRTPFRYLHGEDDERELRAAPSLGQDTDDILRDYGYTDEEIISLRAAKRI